MINPFTGGLEFRRLKKSENVEEGFSDINADFCPMQSNLSVEEKIKLVKEVGEEIYNSRIRTKGIIRKQSNANLLRWFRAKWSYAHSSRFTSCHKCK